MQPTGERMIPGAFDPRTQLEHIHRYQLAFEYCRNKKVLDIACGEGYGSAMLANIAENVIGIDIDETTIEHAANKYRSRNISFRSGTVDSIPVADDSMDVVVSFETLEHHDKHDEMIREIKRVLKKDGLLIMSTPDKKNYSDKTGYKNPFHIKELYEHQFRELIQKFFRFAKFAGQQTGLHSIIISLDNDPKDDREGADITISESVYLLAFASDRELPVIQTSFYSDPDLSENIYREQLDNTLKSLTYRTGKFVLAPARWIRSIFRPVKK